MVETLIPRPAATVMTIRDRPDGYEILMLRRNLRSDFVGGAYVFPGGALDVADGETDAPVFGLSDVDASKRLDVESGGLAFYVACLRELFEEAGLLIACDENGSPVSFSDPDDVKRLAAHRRALNAHEWDFVTIMKSEGLLLDLRGLEYIAHWITPVGPPRRYDTRFFVALAPSDQRATHDAGETVADVWIRPIDALAAHQRGEFEMIAPTIRNLRAVAGFSTTEDVLNYARSQESIPCVQPTIVDREGVLFVQIPTDEGFSELRL
jgi:8-oxo-dGTP pyrophosphatase MutT (NUDIX family)